MMTYYKLFLYLKLNSVYCLQEVCFEVAIGFNTFTHLYFLKAV